jgi:hypothetical protein
MSPIEKVRSLQRLAKDYEVIADSIDGEETARSLRRVTHPTTLTGTLRTTGIALAVAPEPFTTVAGVALLGASLATKRREPASLATLQVELTKVMSSIKSISTDLSAL